MPSGVASFCAAARWWGCSQPVNCVLFLRISPPLGVTTVYDLGEDTFCTMPWGQAECLCWGLGLAYTQFGQAEFLHVVFLPDFCQNIVLLWFDMHQFQFWLQQNVRFQAGEVQMSQPRSQGLSSYRPRRARRDPGTCWSRAALTIENIREGSSVIRQLVASVGFVEFKASRCAARVCCDRHFYPRWLIILSLQTAISNSIYSNVYLKVKQVCREAIYRDRLMLLPSYPLYLWKVSHTSTVDVEQRNFIPH